MSNAPRISVNMPVYNRDDFVESAIRSILNQSFKEFEFIIIDDGSTDGSADILAKLAREDDRIHVHTQPNAGITAARNKAITLSSGDYIAVMDSDDFSFPDRLAQQLAFMDQHPDTVLCATRYEKINENSETIPDSQSSYFDPPQLLESIYRGRAELAQPSIMFKRSAAIQAGLYRNFDPAEDFEFYLRMLKLGSIALVNELLVQYRIHQEQASGIHGRRHIQCQQVVRALHEARKQGLPIAPGAIDDLSKERDQCIENLIHRAIKLGNLKLARQHALSLLQSQPFSPYRWRLLLWSIKG